jgi:hypothetical protein
MLITYFAPDREVIRVHTARDPLLGPVDSPSLAVLALGRDCPETSDIRSGECLRDSERNDLNHQLQHLGHSW